MGDPNGFRPILRLEIASHIPRHARHVRIRDTPPARSSREEETSYVSYSIAYEPCRRPWVTPRFSAGV